MSSGAGRQPARRGRAPQLFRQPRRGVQPASATLRPGATTEPAPDLAEKEVLIRFRHVFKIYRVADTGVVALAGVDLEINRSEFVAVVGPSGSGKSTILNMVGGLDSCSAGIVEVEDRDMARLEEDELTAYRRDKVGFVWQGTARNLVPYLTLRENVTLPLLASGQSGLKTRAAELLEVVGLGDRAKHRPGELSGGEQQRAAIAVALANLPMLLLADEPTAELDTASSTRVLAAFRDVNREFGSTIVMVTHDLVAADRADRIIRLRDGRLVHDSHDAGTVDEEGRISLPEPAVKALWGTELEAEVHEGEIRVRPRSERGPARG